AKRIEEGLNQMLLSLASFPWSVQLLLEDWELHKAGKKRLAEIVVGFNDGLDDEPEPPAAATVAVANGKDDKDSKNVKDDDDGDSDDDGDDDSSDDAEDTGPTGPDPVEVARRMDELAALYAKFQKVYAKNGAGSKQAAKLREEMANLFVSFKLPLPLVDVLVRKLREVLGEIKDHERRI